jgi:hypothetical protein
MNLSQLLNKIDDIENNSKQSIFESIGRGDQYFRTWERDIHPILCEVALAPDQIQQLFKSIETGAGRTMLGKAGDAVKGASDKISDVWFNKFGGMLQNSTPVQNFDAKWEQIKSSIAAKNPNLAAKLAKYGQFAKEHPNWHKFLLGIAGSVSAALGVAVAGGVGAGALAVGTGTGVAVGILNIADRLLQGQKASTAIGRGATTGAIAGLSAGLAAKVADMVKAGFHTEYLKTANANRLMKGTYDYNGQWTFVTGRPEDVQAISSAFDQQNWQKFYSIAEKMRSPDYLQGLDASQEIIRQAAQHYEKTAGVIKSLAQIATASAGGAASAGTASGGQQPTPTTESLNRNQLNELFGITGNKVDASTLEKAWKQAGSPTDSEQVKQILNNAGVDAGVVDKAFADMGIAKAPVPSDQTTNKVGDTATADTGIAKANVTSNQTVNIDDIVARIKKLAPADQQRVLAFLQAK